MLRIYLNGIEYHQDEGIYIKVKELEMILSKKTTRSIFIIQFSGRIKACFLLNDMVQGIRKQIDPK